MHMCSSRNDEKKLILYSNSIIIKSYTCRSTNNLPTQIGADEDQPLAVLYW